MAKSLAITQVGSSFKGHPARTGRLGSWFCGSQQPHPALIQKVSRATHIRGGAKQRLSGAHPVPSLLRTATWVEVATNVTGIEVRQQEELTVRLQTSCSEKSSHRLPPGLLCWGHLCTSRSLNAVGRVSSGSIWLGRGGSEGRENIVFWKKDLSVSQVSGKVCLWLLELQPDLQKALP